MSSIFTKIIEKEIPAYFVYEDDLVLAFLDISQITVGHTLVVPKKAFKNLFELPEELAAHIFKVSLKISKAIKKAFNPKGFNVLNNNGEIAGQSVFHFHIHLIPRYTPGNLDDLFKANPPSLTSKDYAKRAARIKEALL